MSDTETLDLLIEGGNAKPGPATAPVLGALKVNIGQLFQDINEKTKSYAGMSVPVKVLIDKKDHSYKIEIGTPPVSSLLKKELGMKKIAVEKKEEPTMAVGKKKKKLEGKYGKEKEEKPEEAQEEPKPEEKEKKEKEGDEKEEKESEEETPEREDPVPKKEKKEKEIVVDIKLKHCIKVAKMKRGSLLAKTFKSAVKEVVGSCASMPVTVEGKKPKEVLEDIDKGKYDSVLKED